MNTIVRYIRTALREPWKIIYRVRKTAIARYIPDIIYLKCVYRSATGKKLNLSNPKTFNEKLNWLKLHDRKSVYTNMVDKYEAKKYVAAIIGEEYIIPTIGCWDSFDDIDFNVLPDRFVLKCTHDSAGIFIVKDKKTFDGEEAKKKISRCLKRNFYYSGREWPYKNIKPRIIAEQYMEDEGKKELRDYKFFCFNGEVKCYKVDFDRFIEHHANYYDANGKIMMLGEKVCTPVFDKQLEAPKNLVKMKELASKLSKNHPFLRVDLYEVNGRVYFGELTFFPDSGFGKFVFEDNDELLGSWLTLPVR